MEEPFQKIVTVALQLPATTELISPFAQYKLMIILILSLIWSYYYFIGDFQKFMTLAFTSVGNTNVKHVTAGFPEIMFQRSTKHHLGKSFVPFVQK